MLHSLSGGAKIWILGVDTDNWDLNLEGHIKTTLAFKVRGHNMV